MGEFSWLPRARKSVALMAAVAMAAVVQAVGASVPARADATGTGGDYVAVAQTKLFDSRGTTGPLGSGAHVDVPVLGQGGVPSTGVGAVLVDITAISPIGGGYVRVAPADGSAAATSSVTYDDGQTASNSAVVVPGSTGSLTVTNYSGTTGLVVSVEGYFTAAGNSGAAPGGFMPSSGARVLDTRNGTGVSAAGQLSANHMTTIAVAGQGDVPSTAAAAIVNITGLNATANGYVTAWASGTSKPATGTMNYSSAGSITTEATVPIGSDGKIALQLSNGSADVVIDVQGYFTNYPTAGSGFHPETQRLYDTRVSPNTSIPANGTINIDITTDDMATLPAGVAVNITAINPQAAGTLRLWSAGDDEPSTSQLNFGAGYAHSDLEILQPGDDGEISVHNLSSGTVDVVVDLQGWFSDPNEVDADATVTDFDPDVAAQNGYTIKTAADGTEYSVPTNPTPDEVNPDGSVIPSNTKGGKCGTSSVSIHPQLGRYTVYTGFHVIHDAVEYVWTVNVYGPGDDDHEFDWGGSLFFRKTWSGHKSRSIHNNGKFSALVTHPAFAILYDGAICTSAHPSASAYVYTY